MWYDFIVLLPPILAIILAIRTKRVLFSLFIGVYIAALIAVGGNPFFAASQTLRWIVGNIADPWNATLIASIPFLGGMIALVYKGGGYTAFAEMAIKHIRSRKMAQLMAAILGVAIFWDDYTNTIVVGTAMKPITDKYRISRAKLAYIVDSTAAPVAAIFIISVWIGFELTLIQQAFDSLGITAPIYGTWLSSVPYVFYSFLAIAMVFFIALIGRDYGKMYKDEIRALKTGKPLEDDAEPMMKMESDLGEMGKPTSPWLFIIPILLLVGVAFFGMWWTGGGPSGVTFREAIENSDSMTALLWGSFTAAAYPFLYRWAKKESLKTLMGDFIDGAKMMGYPLMFTVMAWTIGTACSAIGTGEYVVSILSGVISPALIPLLILLVSAFVAWCTGSSWGTWGIMTPIAIPLAYATTGEIGPVMFASIGSIFAGGIFGDHCSPISDTTVMSSIFSGCDHVTHVTTQIPYALTAFSGAVLGDIIFAIMPDLNPWVLLVVAMIWTLVIAYILSLKIGGPTTGVGIISEEKEELHVS